MKISKKLIITVLAFSFVLLALFLSTSETNRLDITSEIDIALSNDSEAYFQLNEISSQQNLNEVYVAKDKEGDYVLASKGDNNSFLVKELNSQDFLLEQIYVLEKATGDYKISLRSLRKDLIKASELVSNKSALAFIAVYGEEGNYYLGHSYAEGNVLKISSLLPDGHYINEVYVENIADYYYIRGIKSTKQSNIKI